MKDTSILMIAAIFKNAVCDVIERSCKLSIEASKTAQMVPAIEISKDLGSFVSFSGDYGGLMVLNFDGDAALELVIASLKKMGMPKEDIPTFHLADDVISSIGELTNHIIGKARLDMQTKFELTARTNIPAVVPVTTPIGLMFKGASIEGNQCVRVAFHTPENHRFHMELTIEPTLFANLPE